MLFPGELMSLVTLAVAPRPIVTIAMTDATPMTTPSVVSTDRIAFRRMATSAIKMVVKIIG
jgi:hypothetical protein